MGLVTGDQAPGELLPVPPRRVPARSPGEQRIEAITLLLRVTTGPGLTALHAALDDALRIATGRECKTHYVRIPRRGDTAMHCQRCTWTRPLTPQDVRERLAELAAHVTRAGAGA